MKHLVVVSAGMGSPTSSSRLGHRLADATVAALSGATPEVKVIELGELAIDLAHFYTAHVPTSKLQEAFDLVGTASGVIAVSPVLNAGVSGLFKLFFDLLDQGALKGCPVLMAATGGTARHNLAIDNAMLPMFFYLKALVAPTGVFAVTDDLVSSETGLMRRIECAAAEFGELIQTRGADDVGARSTVSKFASLLGA